MGVGEKDFGPAQSSQSWPLRSSHRAAHDSGRAQPIVRKPKGCCQLVNLRKLERQKLIFPGDRRNLNDGDSCRF
jgi:hypothetical protein